MTAFVFSLFREVKSIILKQSFLLQQQGFLQCGKARSMREAAAERRERPPDPPYSSSSSSARLWSNPSLPQTPLIR